MAGYDINSLQTQIQNLQRQLSGQQQQPMQQIQPPVYQTPQIPIPQPVIPSRQVQYVEGIAGARLYQDSLPSNSSEVIMDKDENIFYMVSKDANGTPSKRIPRARFTIEELEEEEPVFLTRKDFDDFKEEIRQMFASSAQQQQKAVVLNGPATRPASNLKE